MKEATTVTPHEVGLQTRVTSLRGKQYCLTELSDGYVKCKYYCFLFKIRALSALLQIVPSTLLGGQSLMWKVPLSIQVYRVQPFGREN